MIKELSDENILDFLMTSDLNDEYKPEELKFLILKFRYFYRILNGQFDRYKDVSDYDKNQLNNDIKLKSNHILKLESEKTELENLINSLKNKNLSFKERFKGKISWEIKNENSEI